MCFNFLPLNIWQHWTWISSTCIRSTISDFIIPFYVNSFEFSIWSGFGIRNSMVKHFSRKKEYHHLNIFSSIRNSEILQLQILENHFAISSVSELLFLGNYQPLSMVSIYSSDYLISCTHFNSSVNFQCFLKLFAVSPW